MRRNRAWVSAAATLCGFAACLASTPRSYANCPSNKLFLAALNYGILNDPAGVIVRDINGDGLLDLVVTVAGGDAGRITVRLGSGTAGVWDGTFQNDADYAVGTYPGATILADFNNDGIQDLATLPYGTGVVRVLIGGGALGVGDGTFSGSLTFATAPYATDLAAGDFNHDAILDLAVVIQAPAQILVLPGGGSGGAWDGTFGPLSTKPLPGWQPSRVLVEDFNEDGISDLAALQDTPSSMAVLIGTGSGGIGDGGFDDPVLYSVNPYGFSPDDFIVADVNSDGIVDVVVSSYQSIGVLLGNGSIGIGDGTFASGVYYASPVYGAIAMDDFDGDGIKDVAITQGWVAAVLRGGGTGAIADGSFLPATGYPVSDRASDLAIGDFNHDGIPDLVVADQLASQIAIMLAGCPPLPAPRVGLWTECGVAVCTASGERTDNRVVSDGAGGAGFAWTDARSGNADIYAMRLDGQGQRVPGWEPNGTAVCTNPAGQQLPQLVSDGAGGLIVAWVDWREGSQAIYVQHLGGDGTIAPGWPADGLRLGPAKQYSAFGMVPDGSGGALFVWIAHSVGDRLFCQRLSGSGSPSSGWPPGGLAVTGESAQSSLNAPAIAGDQSGRAFLVWNSFSSCSGHGCPPNPVHWGLAHVGAGSVDWVLGGNRFSTSWSPQIVPDGSGGVILAINDFREGYSRIDQAGNTLWTLSNSAYPCTDLRRLVSSGDGGVYSIWSCAGEGVDAFATRVTTEGAPASGWLVDGNIVDGGPRSQWLSGVANDGLGGAFFAIMDDRAGLTNVYALHVNAGGSQSPGWAPIGKLVCDAPGGQSYLSITESEPGHAILCWKDGRNGGSDLYAQKIDIDSPVAVTISLVEATADPSGAHISWRVHEYASQRGEVLRRTEGEEWSVVARLIADGLGRIRFEDRDVSPGERYGYRLDLIDGDSRISSDEAWLTIPAEYVLALDRAHANPVVGDLDVSFVLASGQPGTIELVDVAGRRLITRNVAERGAGRHRVTLAARGTVAPGIYFLRLLQGGQSVTSRICVLQ